MRKLFGVVLLGAGALASAHPSPSAAQAGAGAAVPGLAVEPCTLPGVDGPGALRHAGGVGEPDGEVGQPHPPPLVVVPGTIPGPRAHGAHLLRGQARQKRVRRVAVGNPGLRRTPARGSDGRRRRPARRNNLDCPSAPTRTRRATWAPSFPAAGVRACGTRLQRGASLAHYTSDPSSGRPGRGRRRPRVRAAGPLRRLLGTRAALVYLRRRRLPVRSAVPVTDASAPTRACRLYLARDADRALLRRGGRVRGGGRLPGPRSRRTRADVRRFRWSASPGGRAR